jgi:hypothetical protein
VWLLAIRKRIPNGAHRSVSSLLLPHTADGDSALNNFGTFSQWHREVFTLKCYFVRWQRCNKRSSMLQLRDDACSDVGSSVNTLEALQREWGN